MNKKIRQQVYDKCNGLCAYTGKPLGDSWQVDHIIPQYKYDYSLVSGNKNDISNLLPAIKIINHYKRGQDLEQFREYIKTLHLRINKLPKNTKDAKAVKRKAYLLEVAELFGITKDNSFDGVFYFEKLG